MKSTLTLSFEMNSMGNGLKDVTEAITSVKITAESTVKTVRTLWDVFKDTAAIGATFATLNQYVQNFNQGIQELTQGFVGFDDAMRKANTMAGKDAGGFEMLKNQVTALSEVIPVTRDALAEGLYQTISNGVPEDNWISYLEASAKSAVGGVADLGKVVNVTSTIIKNYGLEWDAAQGIQDKIQMTAKNGVTSFEQLADALPRVAANAATLGVSIDELMATFATLTGVSGNTAEVSTQLAAVFTALIKPSSKATSIATQMGIQFNAAAVKAAGGMQNFLVSLQQSVTDFSAASGILEQEVYGKLFGSAESLRALTPLTGELANKYIDNVSAMANATGEMASAYEMNAESVSSQNQLMKNSFDSAMDSISSFLAAYQPITNFVAMTSNVVISIGGLVMATTRLAQVTWIANAAKTTLFATIRLLVPGVKALIISFNGLSAGQKAAAIASTALKTALRSLMVATGVGIAIAAVTAAIDLFTGSADEASESTGNLTDAKNRAKDSSEQLASMEAQVVNTVQSAQAEYNNYISELSNFNGTREEENELVEKLNSKYGDLFGRFQTLQQWYGVLTLCSQAYTNQLMAEARVRLYADELAKLDLEDYNIRHNADGSTRLYDTKRETKRVGEKVGKVWTWTDVEIEGTSELDKANQKLRDNDKRREAFKKIIADSNKAVQDAQAEIMRKVAEMNSNGGSGSGGNSNSEREQSLDQLYAQKTLLEKQLRASKPGDDVDAKVKEYKSVTAKIEAQEKKLGLGSGKSSTKKNTKKNTTKTPPKKIVEGDNLTREQLSTNIELATKKLTSQDNEEQRKLRENIALWNKQRDAIDLAAKAAERPKTLDTLKDIDAEIEYQRFLRERSESDAIVGIDKEINRLEKLKRAMAMKGYMESPIDEIETYEQLTEEISFANELMQMATADERVQIQQRINSLEKLKKQWDDVLALVEKPADISTLNTIEDLQKAMEYYSRLQQTASADEYTALQKTINALQKKAEAIQRGSTLLETQREIDEINKLSSREYKLKVRSFGFEELSEKIQELRKQLNDLDNPPTSGQRKMIDDQIRTYEQWRKQGILSFETYRKGWSSLQGVGDAVNSITQAVRNDGNAWEKTTAMISAGLQIYDGISEVVKIVQMIVQATRLSTIAKTEEAAASIANTTAQGVEAATATGAAAAKTATIAANEAATASFLELASAEFMAAHASIPFVGFGIAAGFAAGALAITKSMKVAAFADGGIAYGPTLGLFGEYAGASSNPEVVAPLNKLKTLIEPRESGFNGRVEFEIDGRKLKGVLRKVENLSLRS